MNLNGINLQTLRTEVLCERFRRGHRDHLDLNPKQDAAMEIFFDDVTKFLLYGGAASGGKSWLGDLWILLSALSYPETVWFIGREELKKIKQTTLRTFFKVCKFHGISAELFRLNSIDNSINFTNGSRIDLLDLKYTPSDPMYERYGSYEATGGWLEEAGEIAFEAFDVLKSRIGRVYNDKYNIQAKLLITCNPKKNWLYRDFWRLFKDGVLPVDKAFIAAFVDDNHRAESGTKSMLESITDRITRERLLLGNWEYEDDPAALMDYDSITDIFANHHVDASGLPALTCDVARLGSDQTVIRIWKGWTVIDTLADSKRRTNETTALIKHLEKKYSIPRSRVVIDEDGVGGGVVDNLYGCKGFVNNSSPIHSGDRKENYANLKSQCWFRLADRVTSRNIRIIEDNENRKAETIRDLESIKRANPDSDKKLAVIGKDKIKKSLGRSPDFGDSLMMREILDLDSVPMPEIF